MTWEECPPRPDDVMSEDAFMQNAVAYAARRHLQLAERLGFAIHGIKLCAIIPTGFRQPAQGCKERATLGNVVERLQPLQG